MEIRYAISHRQYESSPPSLTALIYAADGDGSVLSNDPHSIFSHLFYVLPEREIMEYRIAEIEESLTERAGAGGRRCKFYPEYPVTRGQLLDLFCRLSQQPISAADIEAVLGIPATTTMWLNHDGYVPASAVLRELRQRFGIAGPGA